MSDYLHTCQLLRIEMRDKEKAEGLGSVVSPPPPTGPGQSSVGLEGKVTGSWVVLGLLMHLFWFKIMPFLFIRKCLKRRIHKYTLRGFDHHARHTFFHSFATTSNHIGSKQ